MPANATVVERIAREGLSYTLRLGPRTLFACDVAKTEPNGVLRPCAIAVGRMYSDGLHDPRLTLACSFHRKRPLGFAWLTPEPRAAWIAIRTSSGDELYEVVGPRPIRVAISEHVSVHDASAAARVRSIAASGAILDDRAVTVRLAG